MTRTNLDCLVDQVKAGVLGLVLSTAAFLLWSTSTRQALSNCIYYLARNALARRPEYTASQILTATSSTLQAQWTWIDGLVFSSLWVTSSLLIFWFFEWASRAQRKDIK